MRFEIMGNAAKEGFLTKVTAQHPNHGTSLEIADVVENLVNLEGIPYGHLNGVGSAKRVELERLLNTLSL